MNNMSFNVVDLVERNFCELSTCSQNRFIDKISNLFSDTQQKLLCSSFLLFLNCNDITDFVVDLDDIWKWIGFNQKVKAKQLLLKHFKNDKDYKISYSSHDQHGGHNKEIIKLNIVTFKLLCLKAGTNKADEIHSYYINLEKLLHQTIKEECLELTVKLQNINLQLSHANQKLTTTWEQNRELEREKILLREFASCGSIVYIIRVKSFPEQKQYVIKIGESRQGVEARYKEHKRNYPECVLLDCYKVVDSSKFEKYLHTHENIRRQIVKDLPNHETENELFLVGKELSYSMLTKIIQSNINEFNVYSPSYIKDAITEAVQELKGSSFEPQHNQTIVHEQGKEIQSLYGLVEILLRNQTKILDELAEIKRNQQSSNIRVTTTFNTPLPTLGPRLQKLNPENLSLIKTYESVAECLKESKHELKRPSIEKAVKENTIYKGFRWAYRNREEDPNIVDETIRPTRIIKTPASGYVAKLNIDKKEILNVYLDRKTACFDNGYTSGSALDTPMMKNQSTRGYYYMLFDKCPIELQQAFIDKYGTPVLYVNGVGQFDCDNNLIQAFLCKYDCIKKLQISDKTLAKALDKNILYGDFYYKSLGRKDKVIM